MELDYEKSYHKLKDWVLRLRPYCHNCKYEIDDENNRCDECHRKSFNWEIDPDALPEMEGEEI